MSEKHSIASKKRWANISPEDRSKIMSARIKKRWANATPEERKAQEQKMRAGHIKNKTK